MLGSGEYTCEKKRRTYNKVGFIKPSTPPRESSSLFFWKMKEKKIFNSSGKWVYKVRFFSYNGNMQVWFNGRTWPCQG